MRLLALWQHLGEPRSRAEEVTFNVEHWRVLSGAELAGVTTPTLVLEAPLDPVFPPPNAAHLANRIPARSW